MQFPGKAYALHRHGTDIIVTGSVDNSVLLTVCLPVIDLICNSVASSLNILLFLIHFEKQFIKREANQLLLESVELWLAACRLKYKIQMI